MNANTPDESRGTILRTACRVLVLVVDIGVLIVFGVFSGLLHGVVADLVAVQICLGVILIAIVIFVLRLATEGARP